MALLHGTDLYEDLVAKGSGKFRGRPAYFAPNGILFHVRGVVDGCLVVRFWSKKRKCWTYEVRYPHDFEYGLYTNAALSSKEGYKAHREWEFKGEVAG